MAQRYTDRVALDRMAQGLCPECGETTAAHNPDRRFWVPRTCALRPDGVADRIAQYRADLHPAPELDEGEHE